jgi:hypothetical protein
MYAVLATHLTNPAVIQSELFRKPKLPLQILPHLQHVAVQLNIYLVNKALQAFRYDETANV